MEPLSWDVPPGSVEAYTTPPEPAVNRFIKRSAPVPAPWATLQPKSVAPRRLVRHLLVARRDAVDALRSYVGEREDDGQLKLLKALGARI